MSRGPSRFVLWLALAMVVVPGCSGMSTRHTVTGRVQFRDGQPVTFGLVECYCPEAGVTCRGTIAQDGTFVIGGKRPQEGAAEGRNQVIVVQSFPPGMTPEHAQHLRFVHARYSRYETSGLSIDVGPQRETKDVLLVVDPSLFNRRSTR